MTHSEILLLLSNVQTHIVANWIYARIQSDTERMTALVDAHALVDVASATLDGAL